MADDGLRLELEGVRTDYGRKLARVRCSRPAASGGETRLSATTRTILPALDSPVLLESDLCELDGRETVVERWSVPFDRSQLGLRVSCRVREGASSRRERLVLSGAECRFGLATWFEERRNCQNWDGYDGWMRAHRADDAELARQREEAATWDDAPLLSLVCPTFNTPEPYLRAMVGSVLAQTYVRFELVVVDASEGDRVRRALAGCDDPRVRVVPVENAGIAGNTNRGIAEATGDYVGFLDHDDFLEPDCLFRYAEAIRANPGCDLLFCNEDMWEDDAAGASDALAGGAGRYFGPKFKAGWDLARLLDGNVVCHMLMVSRAAIEASERTPDELSGAQDYDLTFKAYEHGGGVAFVPRMLYHWRSHEHSSATNMGDKPYLLEAGRRAVAGFLARRGVACEVGPGTYDLTYRTRFDVERELERVAVIRASHEDGDGRTWVERVNDAVARASRPHVVVLDADAGEPSRDLLRVLLGYLQLPEFGVAAPVVLEADGLVSSCGLSLAADGSRVRMSRGLAPADTGYMQFLQCAHVASAVPGTCLAFRREDFVAAGGLDARFSTEVAVADLCLRLRGRGMATVVEPYEGIVHVPRVGLGQARATARDEALLAELHPEIAWGDPCLDPALAREGAYYQLPEMSS